jgi:hypothetical protein
MTTREVDQQMENPCRLAVTEGPMSRLITGLVRSRFEHIGRGLLKLLRLRWRERLVRAEHATTTARRLPTGPFEVRRPLHRGDLLLWVPRGIDSYLIDELTGGYGYSHATIDVGEDDVSTGKPVMAEITVNQTVSHKYLVEYGHRPYVRIGLSRAGVDVQALAQCVESKMGEKYDALEALTLGEVQDPAKEVCSGLIADCLPPDELRRIARAARMGLLHRRSVSVHTRADAPRLRAFVSPNGLAEYYGAPRGSTVQHPETVVCPRPADASVMNAARLAARRHGWKAATALIVMAAIVIAVRRRVS